MDARSQEPGRTSRPTRVRHEGRQARDRELRCERERPGVNVITLGVQNFDGQRELDRRSGWPQAFDSNDFAVFELRGALPALFPVDRLTGPARE